MKNALLVGNGMTSQLISDYLDQNMIVRFRQADDQLYKQIISLFKPFQRIGKQSPDAIKEKMKESRLDSSLFHKYFIEYHLIEELDRGDAFSIETLMKIAHLFRNVTDIDYKRIKKIADELYFNKGRCHLQDANDIDRNAFINYINSFEDVYTTNFDLVLDDAFQGEVQHLHGGFYYRCQRETKGTVSITRVGNKLPPGCAHLIWGTDSQEKSQQMRGGVAFPFAFPLAFGSSVLDTYLNNLKYRKYDELHIWGYSGQNDGHINSAIRNNLNIDIIIYYGNPALQDDKKYVSEIERLFVSESERFRMDSWETIWENVRGTIVK